MRTLQEMYDLAYKGMKSQNWAQALNEDGDCAYLSHTGLKCAIGHTILNIDAHRPAGWFKFTVKLVPPEILNTSASMLSLLQLQSVHDLGETPKECETRFKAYAKKYDLTVPE
jgi:hypothetical protein